MFIILINLNLVILAAAQKNIIVSDQFVSVYATKKTDNIQRNLQLLSGTKSILSNLNDPIAEICAADLEHTLHASIKDLNLFGFDFTNLEIVNDTKYQHERARRGLRFIGEAWAALTDSISPDESDHLELLTQKLKKASIDQNSEIKQIELVVNNDHSNIDKMKSLIYRENQAISNNEMEVKNTENMLENHIKAESECLYGKSIANLIKKEINIILSIAQKSSSNKASFYLFPPENIKKIVKNHKKDDFKVLFESSSDLHFLYETNNAVTHTYNNSIVSVLDLPLANYNQMKNKIVKNFDTSNKLRIANFELISGKKYDLMICNKEIRFAILLSSSDLSKCLKNSRETFFICQKRLIKLYLNDPEICSNKFLGKVLVAEITPKKFIIEGSAGEVQILCFNKLMRTVHINQTATIKLPKYCKAKNLYFEIETLRHEDVKESEAIKNFEKDFELFTDPAPNFTFDPKAHVVNQLKNNFSEIDNIVKQHDDQIDAMKVLAKKTGEDTENLINDKSTHIISRTGLSLTVICVGGIIIFLVAKKIYNKCNE